MQSELETAKQEAEQASIKATEFASLFASLNAEVEQANAQLASAANVSVGLQSSGGAQQPAETFGPNEQPPALYVDTPDTSALAAAHVRVGNTLMAQGNFAEALGAYRDGLAVADRLAKAEPENPEWQNKIALISIKVGDVLMAQGNFAEALEPVPERTGCCRPLGQVRPR